MTQSAFPAASSCSLEAILAERGALPVEEALPILRQVLVQVRALHASGRTHRAIGLPTVHLDPAGCATLTAPEPVRELDGLEADGESCPPELHGTGAVRLPVEIEAARRELERVGVALDPRRIDVYQLGALLCQLLTGQAVSAYLCSPKTKSKVPPPLQPLIDRALGHNPAERFADCEAYAAALEAVGREAPTAALETPPGGSAIASPSNTPAGGADSPSGPSLPPSRDLPFTRLGHYRIDKRIGRGGMGDVYLGYEEALKRQVAIKVLPAELTRSEDFVRRFHAEATAVARVTHPNIVPIYFIGQDAGCHFFAMRYVAGESLDHLLARRGRLGVDETLTILEQCLAGLGAAHRAGLVHRDVKPGNVLLEAESGRALVADFGLVKVTSAQSGVTATGAVMGTVDYIPPEQARGQEVDGRSDLYSVGVMAYRMLSGRLPFEAKTPTAMLFQHAYEKPKPLGEAAPEVPEALAALVDKLMAKDPAARYQSGAEVLVDVRRFRAGEQAPQPSGIIQAPDFGRPPEVAAGLQPPALGNWWRRVRDRAADLFQAHAPEFVKELQSTTQQVDGAVAEYQRRRDRLAHLVRDAQQVIEDLAAQAKSNREAAVAAGRRADSASGEETAHQAAKEKEDCERSAADLERHVAEQRGQLEQMRSNLVRTDATLGRLRLQRDLLKGRLRVAEARLNFEGGWRLPRRRWLVPTAVLLGVAAAAGVLWLLLPHSQPAGKDPDKPEALVPEEKAKEEITNSIGMMLKLIQPGKFLMGSPREEEGRFDNEGPQHEVEIAEAFYMGACPVTKGQFAAFVKDDGYQTDAEKDGGGVSINATGSQWERKPQYTWRHPGFSQGDDHPVVQISWNDATAFCAWLRKKEGKAYDLPTEAEWEYACRAGTTTRFWCGDTDASLQGNANVPDASLRKQCSSVGYGASWDDGYAFTSPVGSFKANPWGLYDMHGNVWQWCADRYGPYPSNKDPHTYIGITHVQRGGSWACAPGRGSRSAYRGEFPPQDIFDYYWALAKMSARPSFSECHALR